MLVQHAQRLDSEIIYDRDFDYDYFGFKVSVPQLPAVIPLFAYQLVSNWSCRSVHVTAFGNLLDLLTYCHAL